MGVVECTTYIGEERAVADCVVVAAGSVVPERLRPNGHVKVASGVVGKRPRTNRHVINTGSIVSKRIGTHGGIVDPHGGVDVVQCVNALSGVAAGISAIR